jgi:hypothetical protein
VERQQSVSAGDVSTRPPDQADELLDPARSGSDLLRALLATEQKRRIDLMRAVEPFLARIASR